MTQQLRSRLVGVASMLVLCCCSNRYDDNVERTTGADDAPARSRMSADELDGGPSVSDRDGLSMDASAPPDRTPVEDGTDGAVSAEPDEVPGQMDIGSSEPTAPTEAGQPEGLEPSDPASDPVEPESEIPLSAAEQGFVDFYDDFNEAYRQRLVDCFNYTASTIANTNFDPEYDAASQQSLRNGHISFDEQSAAECLEQLIDASCLELVDNQKPAACSEATRAAVETGGSCFAAHDCMQPGDSCIREANSCASCQPDERSQALPPEQEGEPCRGSGNCERGLFCKPDASDVSEGSCQRIVEAQACVGTWECPWPLACVQDGGEGHCVAGHPAGASCGVRDIPRLNGWTDHDCAATTNCVTEAGSSTGTCEAAQSWTGQTAPRETYLPGRVGGSCQVLGSYGELGCGMGSYCDVDQALIEEFLESGDLYQPPEFPGTCRAWVEDGQACDDIAAVRGSVGIQSCGLGSECSDGVCTSCQQLRAP